MKLAWVNRLGAVLSLCVAQEKGDLKAMRSIAAGLGVAENACPKVQVSTLRFPEGFSL